ncbi:MAG: nicotinate-nucleotide adenylyltransferase [Candidatus Thiodiazotropha sp. (ex Ctena orbiculata)]|nr:nicotinate-nucleotide adenylyltransferase [Candidatus Thiodiazotropha taylori]MBT3036663.1 nicotinate-nucleotide adenylyltransferase [Candidatus Thiodiazotropha taylori]
MIGVFGGTFDPIHFGHLRTALDVMQGVGLEEIRFIPLHGAVHREQPLAAADLRLEMVRLAIRTQAGFVVDDREIQRAGDSYTVDTLASLRQELPRRRLCLLLGMDAFSGFADWYRPDEILELAHLIVMHRPGEQGPEDPRIKRLIETSRVSTSKQLLAQDHGSILFQPVTQLEISASKIRNLLDQGRTPRFLLPAAVLQFIENKGLYRTNHTK